ncbi:MAG: tetratricopeptide repeat protein [Anaerolineales bacterium]|nr:tetratricopeptide repeat protein [Anaerolineales bacterium]
MTAVLEICLFGGAEIRRGDTPISGFVSSKAPALLAYLSVTARPHQRDALAALLWGEMTDADAKNNLRQTLSNLRKLLEPYLLITRDAVQFDTTVPHSLDIAQFENHLHRARSAAPPARSAALQQAAALYRGDFLAGFYVRDAPEFEEWMLAQRARYRELALHTLHALAEHHLSRGEYCRAIDSATRLLALDAWREEAHRQLMIALARSGQRRAALTQYETCRRLLETELGSQPSAETTTLFTRIQAAGNTPPHNLPPQPTPFVGRTEELAQISACLQNPDCRLLTIVGAGGMGKTRLALQGAEQAHRRQLFLHGAFFVPLVGVDSRTLLVTAVAAACGLQFSGSQNPAAQLFAFLRDRELLLVLDNFEHLLDEAIWLVQLLQQAPGIKLLLTSREPLHVQWETTLVLDGLALPPPAISPAAAAQYSAVQLFASRARAAQPAFALTAETLTPVAHLCRLVDGMPLALELAAASLRHYTCAELAAAISHNVDVLAANYRDIPPRHRSLRAVFEHAWGLLNPAEQVLFAALSVFTGSFDLAAAEKVCDASRPLLAALVDKSLLRQAGNSRFQLHNVLRQYAAQAVPESQQQALGQRHAAFYTDRLCQQEIDLFTPAESHTFQTIQSDLENIRTAWAWALVHEDIFLMQAGLKTLRAFYNVQSRFVEGAEWLAETAVTLQLLATPANLPAQTLYARVLARWASFAAWQGDNEQAQRLFQEALPLTHTFNDPEEIGFVLLNKGYLTMLAGDYDTAGREYQESLAYYRLSEETRGIADALSALGGWHNVTGDWAQARQCLQESVALARELKDEHGLRSSLTNLGNVFYLLGDYPQARAHYEEVLPLCQKVQDRASEAIIQCNLGALAEKAGDFAEAEQRLHQGIFLFTQANHFQAIVHASTMLGSVYREMKAFARARQTLLTALRQAVEKKVDYLIPVAVFEIGRLYQAEGRPLAALPLLIWVVAHPAVQAENGIVAKEMIAALEQSLTLAQVTAVHAQAETLEATAVLSQLQRETLPLR